MQQASSIRQLTSAAKKFIMDRLNVDAREHRLTPAPPCVYIVLPSDDNKKKTFSCRGPWRLASLLRVRTRSNLRKQWLVFTDELHRQPCMISCVFRFKCHYSFAIGGGLLSIRAVIDSDSYFIGFVNCVWVLWALVFPSGVGLSTNMWTLHSAGKWSGM